MHDDRRISMRRTKVDCSTGRHRYGTAQPIGGGIVRRVCDACHSISIDLGEVDEEATLAIRTRT